MPFQYPLEAYHESHHEVASKDACVLTHDTQAPPKLSVSQVMYVCVERQRWKRALDGHLGIWMVVAAGAVAGAMCF